MGAIFCKERPCCNDGAPPKVEAVIYEPTGEPAGPLEAKCRNHPQVRFMRDGYKLQQTFAIIRHADRLDHTPEWADYPGAKEYQNDTPLTVKGHTNATRTGEVLLQSGQSFSLIVCSPYLRCAQTASRIASVLNLPIHFDLDLGEVFDKDAMGGDVKGPCHRDPEVLESELRKDFPNVRYIRDTNGKIKIEGKQQEFPEAFEGARMRFCYKTKSLVQKAAKELMSIIIVTHGDAVAAVVGLMKASWQTGSVPYTAYAIFSRKLKVLEEGGTEMIEDASVYEPESQWKMALSPGFVLTPVGAGRMSKQQAEKQHKTEMKEMTRMKTKIDTEYELTPQEEQNIEDTLQSMDATQTEVALIRKQVKKNTHTLNRENRVQDHPSMSLTDFAKG